MDCGPACLSMIASAYGKKYPLQYLRDNSFITREGVSLLGLTEAAQKMGIETFSAKLPLEKLCKGKQLLPCILHWNQNHFVVLRKITKDIFSKKYFYHIADPRHGLIKLSEEKFEQSWLANGEEGVALFLTPSDEFFERIPPKDQKLKLKYLFEYLLPYKRQLAITFCLLFLGSVLTLILPFLTEALIDKGVNAKNLSIISLILLGQLGVFTGTLIISVFRNWLTMLVGTRLGITIIADFLNKILQLSIKFFETKMMGDFNQRMQDNERVEEFLTSESLITLFSVITFSVFFGVLWYYDIKILLAYLALTILAIGWSLYWLKKRKLLDYYRFLLKGENQDMIYEIISGVAEIKLNQFEDYKTNEWEKIQRRLLELQVRILKVDQLQLAGFEFLNQLKNIFVTFLAATYVVKGSMTLGALLSVSYIIGQMNSPVSQLVNFFRSLQDAKLSLERLNEVQNIEAEEQKNHKELETAIPLTSNGIERGIRLQNLDFQYEGSRSPYVLRGINLVIPEGKITAIVGASGSGKTTLMKLLLRFYEPTEGEIFYNYDPIQALSPKSIRKNCGVVMQDGFIFSDTIERNIATKDENIDRKKLEWAVGIANIKDFIESLPLKYDTKIGAIGNDLSGGQRQRILIARAVYKNPHYILFDEATSALDAENEKVIHDNLQTFFQGKTVLIIAHRLSTVKNADQIVVLKNGKIVEQGNHEALVANKSEYFNLVRNQLDLGS
ncbi:ABC transporter ATP-binding protein [marine bacterium AO1-C]|nr:ABC transporter ATP-binding protein [marine bacterium AO1-C]